MAEIPQPVLDDIRRRIDLAALISEHVALKRSGRGFVGLCPFHAEKTPSFHVDPERGIFHCFGCNAGGTAFTFLMRVTGVTFRDAVQALEPLGRVDRENIRRLDVAKHRRVALRDQLERVAIHFLLHAYRKKKSH